jgi:hypothetical protein
MRTVSRHTTFYDLLDALAKPGCAVCTLVSRTRWRYLDSLAYENVNDPGVRARLRGALGFCNRHAWYFVDVIREVFGTAIIYRDILHTIQAATASPARGIPEPSSPCPACAAEDESGDYAIHTLAEAIDEPEMRSAVAGSDGLCGPHLLRAMRLLRPALRPKVLETTLTRWQERDAAPGLRARATGAPGLFSTDHSALVAPVGTGSSVRPAKTSDAFTCPVCVALRGELGRFQSWTPLDDGVGGLCNVHAWMPQGNDCEAVYRRQIATIGERASSLSSAPAGDWLRNAMRNLGLGQPEPDPLPAISCFVCAYQAASEAVLCGQADAPLCIPHLRRALTTRGIGPLEALQPIWRELDVLLGEYLRKEDYRFRGEPRGIEQKSPRWVVALIAGAVGIR